MKEIIRQLKKMKSHYDFLLFIRDTPGLSMEYDNNWTWLEYNGEEVPNSGKERFVHSSEMGDLFRLAGLNKFFEKQ